MRVLVVDDDAIVLESVRRVLEPEGHEVVAVPSAARAVEHLAGEGCDIMLLDVKMPVRDGYSLLDEVGRRWPGTSVVIMSGYPTPDTIAGGMALGARAFIPKPFSPDELLAVLESMGRKEARHG